MIPLWYAHFTLSDNFFFRDERAKILAEAGKANSGDETKTTSFEDIGRIIGKRWRNIGDQELAAYKKMAAEDSTRYRDEMDKYYKDELTLMCLGHNTTGIALRAERSNDSPNEPVNKDPNPPANSERIVREARHSTTTDAIDAATKMAAPSASEMPQDDKKPSAAASDRLIHENKQLKDLVQQQQLMMKTMDPSHHAQGQGSYMNASSSAAAIAAAAGNVARNPMANQPMNDRQLLNMLLQQQQQEQQQQQRLPQSALSSSSAAASNNPYLFNQIMSQKAMIDQQQKRLKREMEISKLKDALLQSMLSGEASGQAGDSKQGEVHKPASSQRMSAADVLSTELLLQNARMRGGLQTANRNSSYTSPPASNLQQLFLGHQQQLNLAAQRQSEQQAPHQHTAGNSSSQFENLLRILQGSNSQRNPE